MNSKQIGVVVLIIGVFIGMFVYQSKAREDTMIDAIVKDTGSCYLADGTCLHDEQNNVLYIFGGVLSGALLILGLYLLLFERSQEILAKQHLEVSSALKEAKKQEREKDEWSAFLSGFSEDERKVLSAIHEQDGIKQSTLRYRAGVSKTALSLMLSEFEKKSIVSRKPSGKTKQVFLRSWK